MEPRVGLAVGIGGICGAALRWGIIEVSDSSSSWPTGVFIANMAGCAVLGFLAGRYAAFIGTSIFVGLTVGFCGALTTFSSFAVDLAVFLRDDDWLLFTGYLTSSVLTGMVILVGTRSLGRAALQRVTR
jgi:CrcB protein